ncbi:adenylyl-sulfate kinase [Endothiovibrio diazotrophicus]
MSEKSSNVIWHRATVTRARREERNAHRAVVIWFTGLSGSGKSTLAHAVEEELFLRGGQTFVLDGDNIRHGLCSDLGFSIAERHENIRRIGEVAKLMVEAGTVALTAFISPLREDRDRVRGLMPHGEFLEVYCRCDIDTCAERDPKGLYARAKKGEIKEFTGISSPYEEPLRPELVVDTAELTIEQSVERVLVLLRERGVLAGEGQG